MRLAADIDLAEETISAEQLALKQQFGGLQYLVETPLGRHRLAGVGIGADIAYRYRAKWGLSKVPVGAGRYLSDGAVHVLRAVLPLLAEWRHRFAI